MSEKVVKLVFAVVAILSLIFLICLGFFLWLKAHTLEEYGVSITILAKNTTSYRIMIGCPVYEENMTPIDVIGTVCMNSNGHVEIKNYLNKQMLCISGSGRMSLGASHRGAPIPKFTISTLNASWEELYKNTTKKWRDRIYLEVFFSTSETSYEDEGITFQMIIFEKKKYPPNHISAWNLQIETQCLPLQGPTWVLAEWKILHIVD